MKFSEAIEALQNGCEVRRDSWWRRECWTPHERYISCPQEPPVLVLTHNQDDKRRGEVYCLSHSMRSPRTYGFTYEDVVAEDWSVVRTPMVMVN